MERFQQILAQATKLKQSQLKQQRKNFESLPQFLKSGLAYSKKYINLRKQHYFIQHYVAQKLKSQGNSLYQAQKYSQASTKYQQALAIFRFINSSTTQNLKDQHLTYQNYNPSPQHSHLHSTLIQALYLNICSCLTKTNKKDEAIKSADEALNIQQTPKAHYKKAHAYLDYINRTNEDIKLGFFELNTAYKMSQDKNILDEMHRIKDQIDQQNKKQKQWFKFMFQKNKENSLKEQGQKNQQNQKEQTKTTSISAQNPQNKQIQREINSINKVYNQQKPQKQIKQRNRENQFNEFIEQVRSAEKENQNVDQKQHSNHINEKVKIQKTKDKLQKYVEMPNEIWEILYQRDFIERHGSKIYSILQIYNYRDYAQQYRSVFGQCLDIKDLKDQKIKFAYQNYFKWLRAHPFEKVQKYVERYDVQTQWINQKRKEGSEKVKRLKLRQESLKEQSKEKDEGVSKTKIIGILFLALIIWQLILYSLN